MSGPLLVEIVPHDRVEAFEAAGWRVDRVFDQGCLSSERAFMSRPPRPGEGWEDISREIEGLRS